MIRPGAACSVPVNPDTNKREKRLKVSSATILQYLASYTPLGG
jgi:hypothetical protein